MKILTAIVLFLTYIQSYAIEIVFTESWQSTTTSTVIPFNYYENLILLKARLAQEEGFFILDTGASGLVLNSKYFEAGYTSQATAYGISGSSSKLGRSNVSELALDQVIFSNLRADHIDLKEIEERKKTKILGLIGYEVIKDYEIMLNYRERYVTLTKLNASGSPIQPSLHTLNKIDSFPFELANFIPVINITVAEKAKRMGIDTGAEFNVLDNRKNRNVLENFKVVNRINMSGADGRQKQALAGLLFKVKLGDKYRCASMPTVLTNMSQLNKIYNAQLDGILGHSFLAPWIFSINYRKKMIYLHQIKFTKV